MFLIFFYWIFIFLTFLFTVFFLLFLGILKNYKRYSYNFVYMIFYFFYIISKKLEPFWRSLKKKLIHRFLTLERVYFFPFEKKVRNFFQNLKNKYEFFFKTPIVKAIHNFANLAEMTLEFILLFWLYKMPVNIIITNVYLAKFLYHLWPESFPIKWDRTPLFSHRLCHVF